MNKTHQLPPARVTKPELDLIRKAAKKADAKVSAFIRDAAIEESRRTLQTKDAGK